MFFKAIKNIGVFLLTMVVLFSTLSFSVHKHFCGPFLKDVSIVVPSQGCGMEMNGEKDFCSTNLEKSCCNDVVELVKGQDDLKLSFDAFELDQQQFIIAFTQSYLQLISVDDEEELSFIAYSPPLVTQDLPLLYQSFLI